MAMASTYNTRPLAAEVMVHGDAVRGDAAAADGRGDDRGGAHAPWWRRTCPGDRSSQGPWPHDEGGAADLDDDLGGVAGEQLGGVEADAGDAAGAEVQGVAGEVEAGAAQVVEVEAVAAGVGEETGELVAGGLAADEGGEADEQRGAAAVGAPLEQEGAAVGAGGGLQGDGLGDRGAHAEAGELVVAGAVDGDGEGAGARLAARPGAPREGLADVVVLDAGHVREEVGDQRERDLDAGVADLDGEVAGVDEDELAAAGGCAGGDVGGDVGGVAGAGFVAGEPQLLAGEALAGAQAIDRQLGEVGAGADGGLVEAAVLDEAGEDLEGWIVAGGLAGGLEDDLDAGEGVGRQRLAEAVGVAAVVDDGGAGGDGGEARERARGDHGLHDRGA
jgi:hypothetical protein